jgi:hypothetical protein
MFETQGQYIVTRDVRESDVALRKGAKQHGVSSKAELKPSIFTFVISTFATSPSTRVLGLVAKVLTLLLLVLAAKNEGGVGCYEKGIVPMEQWNPKMLNPNGTYAGSRIKNISNRKKK